MEPPSAKPPAGSTDTVASGKPASSASTHGCEAKRKDPAIAEPRIPDRSSEPGFSATRTFDAPRERVWREWTEPEAFADWFGGVESEVPVSSVSMDVSEGGAWSATMFAGPDRIEIHWRGEYLEVAEPERLVLTITDQPDEEIFDLVTVVLTDLGDGRTEMLVEQRGDQSPEEYERAASGWGTFFDRMSERLTDA